MKKYSVVLLSLFLCFYTTSAAAWSRGREVKIPNIDDVEYYVTTVLTAAKKELSKTDTNGILAEISVKKRQVFPPPAIANGVRDGDIKIPDIDDVAHYVTTALITVQKKRLERNLYKISNDMSILEELKIGEVQTLIRQALTSGIDQVDIVEISLLAGGQSVEEMIAFLKQEGVSQDDILRGMDAAGISFLSATNNPK